MYSQIVLSPDEKRLAVERVNSNIANLWILELANGIMSRATFNPAGDVNPVWSPDGRELLFSSRRNGHLDLYRKSIGGGEDELIYHSDEDKGPYFWTKDGWILFNAGRDLYRVPLTGEREPVAALKSEGQKDLATVSQDGRWVAYESNESGRSGGLCGLVSRLWRQAAGFQRRGLPATVDTGREGTVLPHPG